MQIREAEIFNFGKIHKQRFSFGSGINVIYGPNEAGKSTLHAFLMGMLFGMEKGRGRSVASEGYQRYEPWHAPAYYSGALRFEVDGKPFYLERNFYHKEKRDFLRNEADGEELSVAYGDLTMLLGGIHKETFGNTYNISQSGAVTGKELSEALAEYLSDASESGTSGFRVTRAVDSLKDKKKKLSAQLKEVQEEKNRSRAALRLEQEILQQDSAKLQEDIAQARERFVDTDIRLSEAGHRIAETKQTERQGNASCVEGEDILRAAKTVKVCVILTILSLVGTVVIGFLSQTASYGSETLLMATIGMALLLLGMALFAGVKSASVKRMRNASENMCERQEIETERLHQLNQAEQMMDILYEAVNEKEIRIYNISEQLEALELPTARERELQIEIDAIDMAMNGIAGLAKEICEEVGDALNAEVSRYVSAITEGKYDSVRVDEKGKLWVLVDGRELSPDALSRGTLEQFYLALRLAVGETVTKEEPMPIFLDDAFVLYDDERLGQTLRVLANMNKQVLLFTCQKREAELLSQMGLDYQMIRM